MQIDGVPETFPRVQFNEWLTTVGLDPNNLRDLTVVPMGIRATVHALNDKGQCFNDGTGHVATHTIFIRFV